MARSELTRVTGPDREARLSRLAAETRQIQETVARVQTRSRSYRLPPLTPIGKLVLLGTASWLFIAQQTLYPGTPAGEDTGMRDLGIGIILVLAASALETSFPRPPLLAVCALCGIALVLCGVFLDHGPTKNQVGEILGGAFTLLGVLLSTGRTT